MKRRSFIATSALAASGLAVPWVHTVAGSGLKDQAELNLALIGAGSQGRVLINAVRQVPHVRFRALCDIWDYAGKVGARYLARYGHDVNAYVDYREMLDKESSLDGVLIATPDSAHAAQAIACLEKGLHVYCEPMLASTLDDTRAIIQAARTNGKLLQVGLQRRSNPLYQHVQQRLLAEAQLIGTLTAVQTQWAREVEDLRGWSRRMTIQDERLRTYDYADMNQFRNWTWFPKHSAGPYCRYTVHQIDVCNWFVGHNPTAVMASGGNDYYVDRAHWDTMIGIFEYPGQGDGERSGRVRVTSSMFTTTSAGGMRQYERFLGTEGSIQVSENPYWTRVGRESNASDWDQWVRQAYVLRPEKKAAEPGGDQGDAVTVHVSGELELFLLPALHTELNCAPHVANFCAAIREQQPLSCPGEVAWPSHVAAFQSIEAAKRGAKVVFADGDFRV
jgi:predicted dehydrogenase